MKKTGVLTFHRGPNHGGYLQAYELCNVIKQLGGVPEIINYQNAAHAKSESFRPWKYRKPTTMYRAFQKRNVFNKAIEELPLSRYYESSDTIRWSEYDTVIVGSDVVWDYEAKRLGCDPVYFAGFSDTFEGRIASYAASCGTVRLDEEIPQYVSSGLTRFNAIAVRDTTTSMLVKKCTGSTPELVVDPTWLPLMTPENSKESRKGYIAVYAYSISDELANAVIAFAKKKHLKIIASGYPRSWADKNVANHSPREWQEFIKDASYVVTGTFHGALYSMRFGKRFLVVPNDNINSKLETPLGITGLSTRVVTSSENVADVLELSFDHEKFQEAIHPMLMSSYSYLNNVLES